MNCWKLDTFKTWFSKDFTLSLSRTSLFVIDPPLKYSLPQTPSTFLQRRQRTCTHARTHTHTHTHTWTHTHARSLFSMLDSLPLVAARCLVPVRPVEGGSPSKSSHPLVLLSSFSLSFSCISPSNGLLSSLHLPLRLSLTICPSSPSLSLFLWLIRIGGRGTLE